MNLKSLLAVLAASFCFSAGAGAVVIDFEEYASPSFELHSSIVMANGYQFIGTGTADNYFFWGSSHVNFSGSTALVSRAGELHTFSRTDGQSFDLLSIDITEYGATIGAGSLTLTGNLTGGGTVVQTLMTDGVFGPQTMLLIGFLGLDSIVYSYSATGGFTGRFQLDNLNVQLAGDINEIPIPAALPLFLMGLGGIRLARRKKANASA